MKKWFVNGGVAWPGEALMYEFVGEDEKGYY